MKVLLIQPVPPPTYWPRGSFRSRWVPSGIASLAAALRRAGHEPRIHAREEQLMKLQLDWQQANARLRALLEEFQPQMVSLSATTPDVPEVESLARMAKELCGEHTLVAAGGPHPTALPERTLADCPHVDVAALGEGERTIVELADHGPSPDVEGICFRRDGSAVRTPPRAPEQDLDALGPLPYDLFDMDHYTAQDRWLIRWLPLRATNIRTSRGCPNRCRFCAGHLVNGVGVRYHSIEFVIAQVRHVADRFGVEAIHFEDDTVGASRPRLLELCEAIRQADLHRKVKWDCCLRADQADRELLAQMKAAGCIQIEYGFETGSDRMLGKLAKNTTAEMNLSTAQLTHEAGIRVYADIMFGLPDETEDDVRATLRFLRRTRPEVISFARMYPLPGTAIYNALPDAVRDSVEWGEYAYLDNPDFPINVTAMPAERFAQLYREIDKYCLRPALTWQLLRDTPHGDLRRRDLSHRILRFCILHPLRALRVPW